MFAELQRSGTRRCSGLAASLVLHGLLLLMLRYRSTPVSLMPSEVVSGCPIPPAAWSISPPLGPEQSRDSNPQPLVVRVRTAQQPSPARKPIARQRKEAAATTPDAPEITAHGGSPWGSRVPGTPRDRPRHHAGGAAASISRSAGLSRRLAGGSRRRRHRRSHHRRAGQCYRFKLTQGIGYGIDEKVLAILRQLALPPRHPRRSYCRLAAPGALSLPQLARVVFQDYAE